LHYHNFVAIETWKFNVYLLCSEIRSNLYWRQVQDITASVRTFVWICYDVKLSKQGKSPVMITDVVICQRQKSENDWKGEMIIVFVLRYSTLYTPVLPFLRGTYLHPWFRGWVSSQFLWFIKFPPKKCWDSILE